MPVVAITASAMPEDVRRVRAAGFDGYLAKPLDISRFLDLLDWHLSAGGLSSGQGRSPAAAPAGDDNKK